MSKAKEVPVIETKNIYFFKSLSDAEELYHVYMQISLFSFPPYYV